MDKHISRLGLLMTGLLFLIILLGGCEEKSLSPVTEIDFALGTSCAVTLYGAHYSGMLRASLGIAKEVEEKMSMYLPNSEVSRVNTAAGRGAVPVSEETFRLLQRAAEFADLGRGAFDPTIGPLVNLWNIGSGEESVPETGELKEALELVNYRKLRFEEKGLKVFLEKTGMSLDLGGIAKGHAADRMVDYLRGKGAPAGIVNLGGNVYAFGKKPTGGPWKIGIQSPYDNRGVYMGIVEIDEGVVVTSGKYERFFIENGVRYHHILSTIDGFPIENGLASVTILSSDATAADALSTLVFALGLEEGLKLTETLEGVEGIFITEEKTVFTTPGLRDSFKLTDEEFRWGESKDLPVK